MQLAPVALVAGGEALVQLPGRRRHIVRDIHPVRRLRGDPRAAQSPAAGDYRSEPEWGGRVEGVAPRRACVNIGRAAIESVRRRTASSILYARVDTIDLDGSPRLIELEVIEPDLYFGLGPRAQATPCAPRSAP